jgi:propionate CoA-transferase
LDAVRIIAGRACDEISPNAIVNIGIGIPESIARIAAERGILDKFTMTVEAGPVGGIPAGGLDFGAASYPHAIVDQPAQFDFYDGRGLDFTALGAAQIDENGNVNVSKYGKRISGVGGFVNISATAKELVFCNTFTADGIEIAVEGGKVRIIREGRIRKFMKNVEQICFSADRARQVGQKVLYVTERAVFKLVDGGIELIEIAPGIDLQTQVLDLMDFKPRINKIKQMAEHLFRPKGE